MNDISIYKTYYPIINGDNRKYKVQLIKSTVIITEIKSNKEYLLERIQKSTLNINNYLPVRQY